MAAHKGILWFPTMPEEKEAVQEQLRRVIGSQLFRNSQRYPALLRYVVEQTLASNADRLKERTLGIEVFHRAPDYDTNADPVVRVTAGEVRKRLAQYYQEHSGELRIDLPSGSYVPHFQPAQPAALEAISLPPPTFLPRASIEVLPSPPVAVEAELPALRRFHWLLAGLVCLLLAVAGASAVLLESRHHGADALDSFWRPVLNAQQPPDLILGGRLAVYFAVDGAPLANGTPLSNGVPLTGSPSTDGQRIRGDRLPPAVADGRVMTVTIGDALSFARIASLLSSRGARYIGASAAQTSLADLRTRPAVLVGAFNNAWSLHAAERLRYRFGFDQPPGYSHYVWIEDSQKPQQVRWQIDCLQPLSKVTHDYAIVARYFDPETEQEVVLAAGLLENGTTAASEFLTSPRYLSQLDQFAPAGGWAGRNLEAVIETEVVGGRSGPPKVVAAEFW